MEALKKQIKGKKTLVFLDLEGTQFSHEIIAIGAVKCSINTKGKISKFFKPKQFRIYVKPLGQIGRFVQNMTKIDEALLKEKGVSLVEAFEALADFIKEPLKDCAFLVFGSNDAKMIIDSINYSKPKNENIGFEIVKNSIDYLAFISQFIKDDNGNNYSLVNYLKVFGVEPHGISHDPLNDAYDLMNLYIAMETKKDILLLEYLKVLQKQKSFPTPIKKAISKLTKGENVTSEEFLEDCKTYLE